MQEVIPDRVFFYGNPKWIYVERVYEANFINDQLVKINQN